jgi:7-keto-8-aminopelargonate synthetase-like enzyme
MPIVPLVVGEADEAMALCEAALEQGVFVQAIRPPTVPDGTSRLRAVATAAHDPRTLAALRENAMSYRVRRREVVPTGGVRQHGR